MKTELTGLWRSVESNIPGYVPGGECLRFSEEEVHVLEVAQRSGRGRPSITRFVLKEEKEGYRLRPIQQDSGDLGVGWHIDIRKVSPDEIEVIPQHGFISIFRREKEEPNQALEPTAAAGRGSS